MLALHNQAQNWTTISRIRRYIIDTRFVKTSLALLYTSPSLANAIHGRYPRAQFTNAIHNYYAHNTITQ